MGTELVCVVQNLHEKSNKISFLDVFHNCKLSRQRGLFALCPCIFQSQALTLSVLSCLCSSGWGEWTDWGDCDEDGLQHRTRHCSEEQEAEANLCQGNITQSRPCQPHEVPGRHMLSLVNCWNQFAAYSPFLQTVADVSRGNPVGVIQKFNQML